MWLALAYDGAKNTAAVHDPGLDEILKVSMSNLMPIRFNGGVMKLDFGLRGMITHTDYNCLAVWGRRVAKQKGSDSDSAGAE